MFNFHRIAVRYSFTESNEGPAERHQRRLQEEHVRKMADRCDQPPVRTGGSNVN
jgi:hypothetical protein